MANIVEVIKDIERCISHEHDSCSDCRHSSESDECMCIDRLLNEVLELLKQQEWISVSNRLPENAEHPGEFCPKVRVLTIWGETYGWYDPDVEAWYFLEWYTDFSKRHLDFERGDYPGIVYVPKDSPLITHWKPIL